MSEERKSIGAGKIEQTPDKRLRLVLGDKVIKTENLADGAITPQKISPDFIEYVTKDIQNQIDSIQIGGWAISQEFGDDTHIGISQKALTGALNRIWEKLEDITGEVLRGFNMAITPEYFISEEACSVHITANTIDTNGIFESIKLYQDGILIAENHNVSYFEYDVEITDTALFQCVGKVLGIEYEKQKMVTHYNSFWLGAGNTYEDIMDVSHIIPITNSMRGNYDISVEQGQHIIIIVGESLRGGFMRADIGGVEIPFTESAITVSGKAYRVFTSVNVYIAGTYNIDVNS